MLAALYDRERTGHGAVIPVAMLDVVAETMGFALNTVLHGGAEPVPVGMGSPMVAPYGAYPTRDGQTVVLGTTSDREWRRLADDLLDRPDLVSDARYARNADRVAARAVLDAIVGAWCAERDLADIQQRADAAGIGNARLNTVGDLAGHPQLAQRGRWRDVDSPVGPVRARCRLRWRRAGRCRPRGFQRWAPTPPPSAPSSRRSRATRPGPPPAEPCCPSAARRAPR